MFPLREVPSLTLGHGERTWDLPLSPTLVHTSIRFAGDDISMNLIGPCDQSDSGLASVTSYKAN